MTYPKRSGILQRPVNTPGGYETCLAYQRIPIVHNVDNRRLPLQRWCWSGWQPRPTGKQFVRRSDSLSDRQVGYTTY
ncbi:MAG TPA: hypothetical protein VKA08_18895 [Balneolales bacterium]|nr:hypothetical protein [Balneolales bacterium]